MLGLGNSMVSGGSFESVLDLSSKVLHISSLNVTSSDVGGTQLVSSMENLVDGSSVTVSQAVDAQKPIHDTVNSRVSFPFESASAQVDVLNLSSAISLTDAFTIFFVSAQATPGVSNLAYQIVTGSYTDNNNKSGIYLFSPEEDGVDPYFNLKSTQSGVTDEIGIEQFDEGLIASTYPNFICVTKDAGANATVKVYQSIGGFFFEEISDTDFNLDVDFVVDQIGGFGACQSPAGGTGAAQGNMHLYELGVFTEALSESQVRTLSSDMVAKHGL